MAEPSFILFDMSWPEVKANLDKIRIALIPTASCEQHGPNGTFEVDTATGAFTGRPQAYSTLRTSRIPLMLVPWNIPRTPPSGFRKKRTSLSCP